MKANNKYTKMQSDFYESTADLMAKDNHRFHDDNPDYWDILLKPILEDKWTNKIALDFGCGMGRNVSNLLQMAKWGRVDGVDISKNNLKQAKRLLEEEGISEESFMLNKNNGVDLQGLESNKYDFVMSTIVFQHIAVYDIRFNLFKELFRVMNPGAIMSIQMGYGEGYGKAKYYENAYEAKGTNSLHDVTVNSPEQLKSDMNKIGFIDFNYTIRKPCSDMHPNWIYFNVTKP